LREGATNAEYEAAMASALEVARQQGIRRVAFGDICLQSIREYRERQMAELGMKALRPAGPDPRGRFHFFDLSDPGY
jgi:diphthamide synthase (EF-2-diphthine--ammonia ligase)